MAFVSIRGTSSRERHKNAFSSYIVLRASNKVAIPSQEHIYVPNVSLLKDIEYLLGVLLKGNASYFFRLKADSESIWKVLDCGLSQACHVLSL